LVDIKHKLVRRDKDSHFILIKGRIYQKEITIDNFDAPNIGEPNFIMHKLLDLKKEIDPMNVIVGYFNAVLSTI
jgi:hypothetical protein